MFVCAACVSVLCFLFFSSLSMIILQNSKPDYNLTAYTNGAFQQGMQALLDLIFAVEGSISEAAKYLGYLTYTLCLIFVFLCFEHVKPHHLQ